MEDSLEQVDKLLAAGRLLEARRGAEAALKAASGDNTAASEVQAELQQGRKEAAARAARGDVSIPRTVLADGKPLGASTYRLRLGDETAAGRWVEFLRNGTVAGRALAVVIPDAEIREVAKTPPPRNEARVDQLGGGEYVRVWLNRDRTNYLLHLPIEPR